MNDKKKKKPIISYISTSLLLMGFSLMFSLLSIVFMIDAIPVWVQFSVSILFMAPVFYISFAQGRSHGETLYRSCVKNTLTDLHKGEEVRVPRYRGVFHVIGYVGILFIVILLGFLLKNQPLQFVGALFVFPVALMFLSIGVVDLSTISPMPIAIFYPYILLIAGMFILGYLLKIRRLERQQRDILSELRSFNN